MGFYGSNDPTNSVKALKEVVVLRIRLQPHQVHFTVLQTYTMYNEHKIRIRNNEYKNSEMGPVRQKPTHHNHFTAPFPGQPGRAGARRELLDFYCARED